MIEKYLNGLIIPKDEMTPLERSKCLNEGREVDRIMCSVDGGETLAPLINCTLKEYYHSAEKMCQLEEYMYETFGSDSAGVSCTLRGMAEAMGAKIKYSDYSISVVEKQAFSLKEVEKARLVNIDEDGRLPIILKAVEMVKKKLGDKVPVGGTVTAPFTVAAMTVGTEELLIGTRKCPEKVRQLLDIIVENNNRYIDRLLEIGVGVSFADPVSSTSLISAKQYEEFSLPYFQQNVDHVRKNGSCCSLHICGTSQKIWGHLNRTGISTFSLDNVEDIDEAKKILGPHMRIRGNVPPVEVMRYGTPQDVLRAAKKCIRKGYDAPNGYMLALGCQTPVGTPKENMKALMDAARLFGRYPIDKNLLFSED